MLLNCHTYYSFGYGAMSPEQLLEELKAGGYDCFALTDINNSAASLEILRQTQKQNIRPVAGIDFRNGIRQKYIGIAKNNQGHFELNQHLTEYLHQGKDFPVRAPDFHNAFVIYPFRNENMELRENEFIGVDPKNLKKLNFTSWKNRQEKLVILHPVTFRHKRDFNTHRLLRAIHENVLLSKLPPSQQATMDEKLLSKEELLSIYGDYSQLIENTERLLDECFMKFDFGQVKNKKHFTGSEVSDYELLKREAEKGLKYRYPNPQTNILERLRKELNVIRKFGFCSYFLINQDIVNYAHSKGYYHVGRGSGANSLVAYLLRITNVDPVELDLYFERFINPYRKNPPDFDIDFSWTDRADVTRYIFEKHGYEYTALLGSYITFNHKSAFRELGKVFGLPEDEISRLQKNPNPAVADEYGKWVIKYSKYLEGFPRHLSVHASGIVISELPMTNYSGTFMPPKGFPTTQFDMYIAEDIGLHKFDILGQRGLGKIKDSLEFIKQNRGVELDIHDIKTFKEDEKLRHLLKTGQAIGCFYIESPAMRMLLTKLKADDYRGLVAASSIIRPGVSKSGMMREYILRFQDEKRREKAKNYLPELYEILEDTYGVMVYQEDVIKVAHYFAGLTLEEADVLRRGMSWKFRERNEFSTVREKFFSNCRKKKYREEIIQEIWKQIESFANYAFAKGHSASYAVESFQALYLKAYYPLEYMVATLNHGGGFYSPELYVHEARMHGATIEPPCINNSNYYNTIKGNSIFLGFYLLYNLETETVKRLLAERQHSGKFSGLRDFVDRVGITLEQLIILIRINAFRFTGKSKKALLWDAHFLLGNAKKSVPVTKKLFTAQARKFELPELWKHELEEAFDELELLGFTLSSPFKLLESPPSCQLVAKNLSSLKNKKIEIIGYLVHRKPTRTSNGKIMYFGTWLDQEGHWIDTVHFPKNGKVYGFTGPGCYHIKGRVVQEYDYVSIEANEINRLKNRSMDD